MASTYVSLHYHLVFGTKNREPIIDAPWRSRFHEYLGGTALGLGAVEAQIGGTADHVHLLVTLKASHTLADFMRELKKASSIWVHEQMNRCDFAWQEGYAAFTVSATSCGAVRHYIDQQAEHHRKKSFREEVEEMLMKAGVVFNPAYLE